MAHSDLASLAPADPGPPAGAASGGASRSWDALYASLALAGLPILLWRRFVLGKDRGCWKQKWGFVPERAPHKKRIWIHAVSVGEAQAALPLYERLKKELPGAEVVFSTTTNTGQEVARKRYGAASVFYYPLDFSGAVRRAFERVQPRVVVLMELEVWPNFTREALARGVPVVVLNGRITERSARRYRKAWRLLGGSFARVRRWLMQSGEYAQRITELGVEPGRVELAGNIKYDALETRPLDAEERAAMREELMIAARAKVIVGGSTHPGEEDALLDAYRTLREKFPGLRLVLVPRHPQNWDAAEKAIRAHGFPCLRRSALKERKESGGAAAGKFSSEEREQAVILGDTMGELKNFYRAADVAFVGGSLIPHGGQNMMEPAGMGLPVCYGPHTHNFTEAVAILKSAQGAWEVENAAALSGALEKILSDPAQARAMGARAREALLQRQGATARCVEYLKTLLEARH